MLWIHQSVPLTQFYNTNHSLNCKAIESPGIVELGQFRRFGVGIGIGIETDNEHFDSDTDSDPDPG
jgi:hypothetical protein